MAFNELKNSKIFTGIVCYRYMCETFKRSKPHRVSPITDRAELLYKSDQILFNLKRKEFYEEYIEPYYWLTHKRRYMTLKKKIDKYTYDRLKRIYRASMHPHINPLQQN